MKTVAIIQARMGSTRLKGKMLLQLGNKPFIQFVVEQVKQAKLIDEVIVAIPNSTDNNELAEFLLSNSIKTFRGSEDDVLSRYAVAAKENNADIILRLTGDNPFTDTNLLDELIKQFKENNVNYMCSKFIPKMPRGIGVEIMTREVLDKIYDTVTDTTEKEHVTAHILNNLDQFIYAKFDFQIPSDATDYYDTRLTVDTPGDFELASAVLKELGEKEITWQHIFEVLDKKPELLKLNEDIKAKADVKKYYHLKDTFTK